jgi:CHAT domain-containing protein
MRLILALILCLVPALARAADDPAALMDEAFRAVQEGQASAAGAALRQMGLRAAAGSDARAALLRAREEVALRLAALEGRLADPAADRLALGGEAQGLAAELAALDARVAEEFPDFARLTRPAPLRLAEAQALLAPDEALILFFHGPQFTDVFALSPTRAAWHQVATGGEALPNAVTSLREELDPTLAATRGAAPLAGGGTPKVPRPSFDRGTAHLIYSFFLAPLEPVFAGARHVYVVPHGPFTSLPFGLLVTRPPEGADDDPADLRATPWMIRAHALTTLPSVEALAVLRRAAPQVGAPLAFVGFGAPDFAGGGTIAGLTRGAPVMAAGLADADLLRALPPLPKTRGELRAIARTLGEGESRLHLGPEATEAAVKAADLAQARVLAFATHGLLSGEIPGLAEPALVLTPPTAPSAVDDGLLTASEIIDLRLNADWVILSACNTAGGEAPGAEGLSGLARAFLFAGARAILVSHWPVRDDAAARLTTGTFAALAAGEARGKAEALRAAMLALMEDPRDPTLAHPSAWAPFVVVGDGG